MVTQDLVSIGSSTYSLSTVKPFSIIRIRFYAKNMEPLVNPNLGKSSALPFQTTSGSRIMAMKALRDGGVAVIIATGDRLGPFSETANLTGYYNFSFTVKGFTGDPDEDKKSKSKSKK